MTTVRGQFGLGLPVGISAESDLDLPAVGRLARAAAEAQGFDHTRGERVTWVASEMASNLVRHTRSGRISFRLLDSGDRRGVELVATDGGQGMPVTGVGGAGRGPILETTAERLGAIARASDLFDLFSAPGRGTVMMSRLWDGPLADPGEGRFLVGSMREPYPGEDACGDAWAVEQTASRVVALVADGLGHGVNAAEASGMAVEAFRQRHHEPVEVIVGHLHRALHGTRGAAIAVAEVDPGNDQGGLLRFCGIGNIAARILLAGQERYLISQFGIAGYQRPVIRAFEEPWPDGAMLVMHSDGLSPAWDLTTYSGILSHHPQLAAATVLRDAPRAHDDAVVLALCDGERAAVATTLEAC